MNFNNLKQFFPNIRTRKQVLAAIAANPILLETFNSWPKYHQEEFLDMCTGARGIKMLYDTYFKEIFSPEIDPERLSKLLSVLIGIKVTVKYILPNDTTRLGDESSLVITDIVVELEDGSIANVEVQKIGYAFTGQRASCYSADLLLRQYKRIRDQRKEQFTYKDIAPVYTIILMETSPASFQKYKDIYIHKFSSSSDSGLQLRMLQNFIFVPIDIFLDKLHNEGIQSELDAWLAFLGCDEPEYIIELIQEHPYFKKLYEHLYDICQNTERMINMFSKELQILDRNTVKYMMDELQEELDDAREKLDNTQEELSISYANLEAERAEKQVLSAENQVLVKENQSLIEEKQSLSDENAHLKLLLEKNGIKV